MRLYCAKSEQMNAALFLNPETISDYAAVITVLRLVYQRMAVDIAPSWDVLQRSAIGAYDLQYFTLC